MIDSWRMDCSGARAAKFHAGPRIDKWWGDLAWGRWWPVIFAQEAAL